EHRPVLGDERSRYTGRDVAAEHGRFDRNRTAAAERIDERLAAFPERKVDEPRRQRLAQRRGADEITIAALVQAVAAGVEKKCRGVLEQRDLDRECRARLRKARRAVRVEKPLDDRLLHGAL